jgi:hypothetical protein
MIVNGYCTLNQFKQRFMPETKADASRDADLELIIQAVSRKIDQSCGRVFYESSSAADTVRYFTAQHPHRCYIDDVHTITTLKTDDDGDGIAETTWSATADYWAMPRNTPFGAWPYMWLQVMPEGSYTFPAGLVNGVEVTGAFGWAAVPDEIREACLLQSNRIWQRRAAPFGVLGANEFGAPVVINKLDPDIQGLLELYMRTIP